jgi:DNA helicase-2/ATP-dependent DNA helicase PcrA
VVEEPSGGRGSLTVESSDLTEGPRVRRDAGTALSATCRVCRRSLSSGAERKLQRHLDCAPGYDEAVYEQLTTWRRSVATELVLPAFCVFTDATLMAIAERRPQDASGLLSVPGVGRVKCEQYGPTVLAILAGAGPVVGAEEGQSAKPGK